MPLPQGLQPPPEYREMAQAVINNAPVLHDFLDRCQNCGLPVDAQRAELRGHVEFAQNFLRSFFGDEVGG